MRGEKVIAEALEKGLSGSPPHARGKVKKGSTGETVKRITPACAGKSRFQHKQTSPTRDHPRMRGEKCHICHENYKNLGSPPHARGKVVSGNLRMAVVRITPACAGKS